MPYFAHIPIISCVYFLVKWALWLKNFYENPAHHTNTIIATFIATFSDEFDEETKARHEAVIKRYALEKTRKENLWRARLQRVIKLRTKAIEALPPVLKKKVGQ